MYLTQGLRRAAQIRPREQSTVFRDRRRIWSETADRVARIAGGLEQAGVQPGDRVAILALNSDRFFELMYAIPWRGAAMVPVNTRLATAEIQYLNDEPPTGLRHYEELAATAPIADAGGYWNKPAATAAVLQHDWYYSGDAGYMDDEGFIFIVDRLKDMIISGGENVYSAEVEHAISLIPGIVEVAVIGIPDDKWGESVHAAIVPSAGANLTAEAVIAHCRTLIAGYKCPRSVEFRDTPLPLTGAGKVLKRELREPFWNADQ
jgi:acyl-CoA synthetase (AMP-forming)/AMP-acid ligase II